MLAVRGVVRHVVRLAHVPFLGGALRVVAEGVVEALEVGQVRHVLDQRLHPRLEGRLLRLAALGEPLLGPPRHVGEGLDQVREVAPRVVDVDLDEHAVARRLVDLDVVLAGEQRLELGAVVAGGATEQRDPRRVEVELVVVERPDRVGHRPARRAPVGEARLPVLGGDHLGRRGRAEVLGDQRVRVDRPPHLDRQLDGPPDQLVALELHLPARHVERGDDLQIGRGRGVGEERLLEGGLDRVEVLIGDHDDRALAERRHRLVHGVGLVDAHPHLVRVRQELQVQELGVLRIQLAGAGLERLVALAVLGVVHQLADGRRRAHRRAPPQERREAREPEPRLVPEEDEVGLDGQALQHRPLDVGDVAVEGAVGQHHQLRAVQLALRLQLQERLLDRLDGQAAVHRVLGEREGVDVERLGAGQHQPVVVRLVAVAVDQDDVARLEQRLVDDLVRRRRAVGDEEAAVAAERAGRLVLRDLDVAGRLEQAVEAAGGRRRLGEEQVGPVELAHVADPVRLEDRLPAGHRQRVEGADRPLRVPLEVVEVRRLVAVLHAVEDRQVDLHRLLDPVEDPPDRRRLRGAGQPGDVAVGREIDVELRPPPAHQLRQEDPEIAAPRRLGDLHLAGQDLAQHRHRVLRGVPEAVADHDRLEIGVEDHGEHRVLEAADHDRLVDELVLDAPQPAEGLPDLRPHGPLGGRDEQDLEVRPPALTAADRRRQDVGQMGLALLVRLPGFLVIPVAVG